MKKIAVMTSGGDAPGMNAAIRAVVRCGISVDLTVLGIKRGFKGLLENDFIELNSRSVSDIIQKGGTILRTARSDEFLNEDPRKLAVKFLSMRGVQGVIVIGGDGSLKGANELYKLGVPTVGIPATIDNDLAYTDYTLGFDTACNTVLEAINKLRDTMSSHDRISVIEVMGNKCGDLALMAGLGGGAEIILVPEIKIGFKDILNMLQDNTDKGKNSSIIVVAEGAGSAALLCERISKHLGKGVRATVLGHLQRGGSPSARDRFLGTAFGAEAVTLLKNGKSGRLCGVKEDKFYDIDIEEGLKIQKEFNCGLYNMAGVVSNSMKC